MRLLLDTHAFLWWLDDDNRLGSHTRAMIRDPGNDVLVSVVSLWEVAVKLRVGKLHLDIGKVVEAVPRCGFSLLAIEAAHLVALGALPSHQRDPFDHLLIAQAISEEATFVSADRHVPLYSVSFVMCT